MTTAELQYSRFDADCWQPTLDFAVQAQSISVKRQRHCGTWQRARARESERFPFLPKKIRINRQTIYTRACQARPGGHGPHWKMKKDKNRPAPTGVQSKNNQNFWSKNSNFREKIQIFEQILT